MGDLDHDGWRPARRGNGTHSRRQGRKADLGAVGGRAWDAVGVTSLDALQAPFLIDSYALEQDVLESAIPARMLQALGPLGLAKEVRPAPLSPALGRLLRKHIAEYGIAPDGRLFQGEGGGYFPTVSIAASGKELARRR
jgi:hypothetical protein